VSANVVVGAKIENTYSGKQFGVGSADVVYVEMVEGNLSRLIAIFHSTLPTDAGPIRSVRTTDPDVLSAYGAAALLFSGGAGGPLDNFASSGLIDGSYGVASGYWKSSTGAPYNLHVDVAKAAASLTGLGTPKSPGFTFGTDYPALAGQRSVTRVAAAFSNALAFTFDNGVYRYIRKDAVQSDGATGDKFEITNLVVQHVEAEKDGTVDVNGSPSYKSRSIGSGAFTLYRDGKAIDGTWTRPDAASPTSYLDSTGAPAMFRPGKTWIVLAPPQIKVSES
jgi:hypothetical protein